MDSVPRNEGISEATCKRVVYYLQRSGTNIYPNGIKRTRELYFLAIISFYPFFRKWNWDLDWSCRKQLPSKDVEAFILRGYKPGDVSTRLTRTKLTERMEDQATGRSSEDMRGLGKYSIEDTFNKGFTTELMIRRCDDEWESHFSPVETRTRRDESGDTMTMPTPLGRILLRDNIIHRRGSSIVYGKDHTDHDPTAENHWSDAIW